MELPKILVDSNTWVCANINKEPICARTGFFAKTDDSRTWVSYPQAIEGAQRFNLPYIGYVFGYSNIQGIDLDDCITNDGRISDQAKDIILTMGNTYTERSVSRRGLHILFRGELTGKRRQAGISHTLNRMPMGDKPTHFRIYDCGYFIITGDVLDDAHMDIQDCTVELQQVWAKYLQKPSFDHQTQGHAPAAALDIDDTDLIRKAAAAKNGHTFRRLWSGDISGNNDDDSAADFALINCLIFWCGRGDPARINRLFRQSGLYRLKWERRGMQDITNAINTYNSRTYPELQQQRGRHHEQSF